MSVITVTPDLVEVTTLILQPSQSFSSSSSGITGSIRLASKPSQSVLSLGGVSNNESFVESAGVTSDDDILYAASQAYLERQEYRRQYENGEITFSEYSAVTASLDFSYEVYTGRYLEAVTDSDVDAKQYLTTYPIRFTSPYTVEEIVAGDLDSAGNPTYDVPSDDGEWKLNQIRLIKDLLIPSQIVENPLSHFGYGHYNSINFISSSNFGTSSAIIYPNFSNSLGLRPYTPEDAFTLDFFIKPKAPTDEIESFRAGTIFHISSSICVSLVSGSQLGPDRKPETFRILLQLSQSADTAPSLINPNSLPLSFPNNLIFATDEVLHRDTWHRVTIRWGASSRSSGTGSILVDENEKQFSVNSSSISTGLNSNALFLGNYYDSGDNSGKFFNSTDAILYGTEIDPGGSTSDPTGFKFSHPLNAEIHHISLFKEYLSSQSLEKINDLYITSSLFGGPVFFIAPFFTPSVNPLSTYVTPSLKQLYFTDSPVSYELALGYNTKFVHLQNFLLDYAEVSQPRAYGMSEGTAISSTFDSRTDSVDGLLMLQQENRRRNFTILPCDDGNFTPNFGPVTQTYITSPYPEEETSRFNVFNGKTIYHMMSLENLAPGNAYISGEAFSDFDYDGSDYPYLPFFQDINYLSVRTSLTNRSSNLVTIFSIPSAYYLNRIIPGSFTITDSNMSGSGGLSFTLKDDAKGNLYRCDTRSEPSKWNRVGAIFYAQGIVAILNPHLSYFGKNSFEMSFKGEVRRSVANFTVPASPGIANSSFNETYKAFPPTNLRSEQSEDFTYITGINLHDKNLNVVMRAKLAQPVQKREGDELVFRLRYDF